MAKYRGQERFGVEPAHGCGRVRDHAGRAGDGAQQGDLPDAFAPAAAPQEVPVLPCVEFADRGPPGGGRGRQEGHGPGQAGTGRQDRERGADEQRGGQNRRTQATADETVVADQSLRTLALDRETFLVAVTGNRVSSAEADALVTRRLAADSPADPDAPGPA